MSKYEWLWKTLKQHKTDLKTKFEANGKPVPLQHTSVLFLMDSLELKEPEANVTVPADPGRALPEEMFQLRKVLTEDGPFKPANPGDMFSIRADFLLRIIDEYAAERAAHNEHVTQLCEAEEEVERLRDFLQKLRQLKPYGMYHEMIDDILLCSPAKPAASLRPNPRPALRWFAQQMEITLRKNDYKGGWHDCNFDFLEDKLHEEYMEVKHELLLNSNGRSNEAAIIKESADLSNICMMIADNARRAVDNTNRLDT